MKSSLCRSGLAAGAALAFASFAAPAMADDLVYTAQPSNFGTLDRANLDVNGVCTNLVQRFELPTASSLNTLAFFGLATDTDMYIVDDIGAAVDDETSILWSAKGYTQGTSGRQWHEFDLGGLNLAAGEYYVVMGSDDATGGRWSRVTKTGSTGIEARGFGAYIAGAHTRVASLSYTMFEGATEHAYALRISGTPVPAPGALALAAFGGVAAARRRRR